MSFPCETQPIGAALDLATLVSANVPRIDTDRLVLRVPVIADFDAYAAIVTSSRGRYLSVMTREEAWYDFCQMVAGWMLQGHGLWSIDARDNGTLLGFVLLGFDPEDPEPELGYMMVAEAEGQGFAFEAAQAARTFAFDRLGWTTMASFIAPDNARSRRLAERLGARLEREIADEDGVTLLYRHQAEALP